MSVASILIAVIIGFFVAIALLIARAAGRPRLYDALSGYWLLRARTLPPLLDYVTATGIR